MPSCCLTYAQALKIAGGHIPTAERLEASTIEYTVLYKDWTISISAGYDLCPCGYREQFRKVEVFDEILLEGVMLYNEDSTETDILDSLTKQELQRLENYVERREEEG